MDAELHAQILSAPSRVLWEHGAGPARVAGHGYLVTSGSGAALLHLIHSAETTPRMIELSDGWERGHPPSELERLRRMVSWRAPGESPWGLYMDAGSVEQALAGRTLTHRQVLGPVHAGLFDGFPEAFLRAPVRTLVQAEVGDVSWPEELNAAEVRPYFEHARLGATLVISACRYGSRHADAGQDRTAAVWLSQDSGQSFRELGWQLPVHQRCSPSGLHCFPPEQIDRVILTPGGDPARLEVEWEDPWIAFEPGQEWIASYDFAHEHWVMRERKGVWSR